MSLYDRPPASRPRAGTFWLVLLLLIVAGLAVWRFWPRSVTDADAVPRAVTPRGELSELEKSTIDLFRRLSPSVVHITTLSLQRDAFQLDVQQVPEGTGSGFIWNKDGHIVTNYHVIQKADAATVTLADRTTWKARLVGSYPDTDLAVLWIEAPKDRLQPIPVGTSSDLQVGQSAFAIGNPFGLDQTLTRGIVSALDRQIQSVTRRPIKGVIQTDAAINPGNSGGPLLDSAGRLIGVNTAIFSLSGTSAGIGFAIPVDEVNRIVPELIRHGQVIRPRLGVQVASDQLTRQWDMEGALIMDVLPDSPASKAGLRPTRRERTGRLRFGDLLVALEGKPIRSPNDLFALLNERKIGETVRLTVEREGERLDVQVTLEAVNSRL